MVVGKVGDFLSQFEECFWKADRLVTESSLPLLTFNLYEQRVRFRDMVEATVKAHVQFLADVSFFSFEYHAPLGLNFDLTVAGGVNFDAQVGVSVTANQQVVQFQQEELLHSQAIPQAGIVLSLPLGLPQLRLGCLAELKLSARGEVNFASDMDATAQLTADAGLFEAQLHASRPQWGWGDLSLSSEARVVVPTSDAAIADMVSTNFGGIEDALLAGVDATFFVGLEPRLVFSALGIAEVATPFQMGTELTSRAMMAASFSLNPVRNPAPWVLNPEVCDTCHHAEANLDLVVKQPSLVFRVFGSETEPIRIPVFEGFKLPIADACFIEAPSDTCALT